MDYRFILLVLGVLLILTGLGGGTWSILIIWLGCNSLALSYAHHNEDHGIFGKRADGRLSVVRCILFLPLISFTYFVWHILSRTSSEPAYNKVSDHLYIGRRLASSEYDLDIENYIDLTTEFAEPANIRSLPSYFSFPILDGGAPSQESLHAAISHLRPGRSFVHCAQGHGRTGLFSLAMLLTYGDAKSVEDGLSILRKARPGIRLNGLQLRCIREFAARLKYEE